MNGSGGHPSSCEPIPLQLLQWNYPGLCHHEEDARNLELEETDNLLRTYDVIFGDEAHVEGENVDAIESWAHARGHRAFVAIDRWEPNYTGPGRDPSRPPQITRKLLCDNPSSHFPDGDAVNSTSDLGVVPGARASPDLPLQVTIISPPLAGNLRGRKWRFFDGQQ